MSLKRVVKFHQVDAQKWLSRVRDARLGNDGKYSIDLVLRASTEGKLVVLKWLYAQGMLSARKDEDGYTVAHAAARFLTILKWMHTQGFLDANERNLDDENVAHIAARLGRVEILQWLHWQGLLDAKAKNVAKASVEELRTNRLRRFDISLKIRQNHERNVAHSAATTGKLAVLVWLQSEGLLDVQLGDSSGETVGHIAAKFGHLNILTWLHSEGMLDTLKEKPNVQGQPLSHLAALRGHLEVLKFLHARGMLNAQQVDNQGWNIAFAAASVLDLSILQWLHSVGLFTGKERTDRGETIAHYAFRDYTKTKAILSWLNSLNLFDPKQEDGGGSTILDLAAVIGMLDLLKWLLSTGLVDIAELQKREVAKNAARNGHLPILKWLQEIGALNPGDKNNDYKKIAATAGSKPLEWLKAQNLS